MKLVIHFGHAKAHAFLGAPWSLLLDVASSVALTPHRPALWETSNEAGPATYKGRFRKITEEREDAWAIDREGGGEKGERIVSIYLGVVRAHKLA